MKGSRGRGDFRYEISEPLPDGRGSDWPIVVRKRCALATDAETPSGFFHVYEHDPRVVRRGGQPWAMLHGPFGAKITLQVLEVPGNRGAPGQPCAGGRNALGVEREVRAFSALRWGAGTPSELVWRSGRPQRGQGTQPRVGQSPTLGQKCQKMPTRPERAEEH